MSSRILVSCASDISGLIGQNTRISFALSVGSIHSRSRHGTRETRSYASNLEGDAPDAQREMARRVCTTVEETKERPLTSLTTPRTFKGGFAGANER